MTLVEQISKDMTQAMKARDQRVLAEKVVLSPPIQVARMENGALRLNSERSAAQHNLDGIVIEVAKNYITNRQVQSRGKRFELTPIVVANKFFSFVYEDINDFLR